MAWTSSTESRPFELRYSTQGGIIGNTLMEYNHSVAKIAKLPFPSKLYGEEQYANGFGCVVALSSISETTSVM